MPVGEEPKAKLTTPRRPRKKRGSNRSLSKKVAVKRTVREVAEMRVKEVGGMVPCDIWYLRDDQVLLQSTTGVDDGFNLSLRFCPR